MKKINCLMSMMTIAAALALSVSPLQGAETGTKWGLGLQGGAYKLVLTDHSDAWTPGWLLNADLKYKVAPRVAIGVEGSLMRTYLADLSEGSKLEDGARGSTDNIADGPRQRAFVAGVFAEYHFREDASWSPYVVAGPGLYLWKWSDKDGNTLMSDDAALDDPARVGMSVPPEDLVGDPYELKDQELYAMVGAGVEFFQSEALSFELGAKFRYLTHLLTSFTDDQDVVGSDPGQLDLPRGIAEVNAGLTFHFGGESCPPSSSNASAIPTSGAAPLSVQFTGSVTGGCPEYTYDWNFGDGSSSSVRNPSHDYATEGSYYALLTVTDSRGTLSQSGVTITAGCPILTSTASGSPMTGTAPLTVKFAGSASGGCPAISYKWDFGDGSTSTDQNPSHTYKTAGSYRATLTVSDSKTNNSQKTVSIGAAEEFVPTPEKPVVLRGVNFEHDKAVLLVESREILDRVAASLINHPEVNIEVAGHCDSDGSDVYNLGLSDRRAKAVRDYLIEQGLPATRMTSKGYGESEPIASNATKEGKAANRRVELKRR